MAMLSLHTLKSTKGSKRQPKVLGRGNASGKGTTAGRGGKGQTARTGGRAGLKLLGMRHIILATPKLRGFRSQAKKSIVVNINQIDEVFKSGELVNIRTLAKKGLVPTNARKVKILGLGETKKKFTVSGCVVSEGAKQKITAAGGEIK
jgi:large subunit ribosomal protein L15